MYVIWLHIGLSLTPYFLLTVQIFPGLNFWPSDIDIDRNVGSFTSSSNYNSKWEILQEVIYIYNDKLLLNFGAKFQDQFILWDVKLQIAMAMFGMKFIDTINKSR